VAKIRPTQSTRRRPGRGVPVAPGIRGVPVLVAVLIFVVTAAAYWGTRGYALVWDDQSANLATNTELLQGHYSYF